MLSRSARALLSAVEWGYLSPSTALDRCATDADRKALRLALARLRPAVVAWPTALPVA